ncbi:MAG: protein kinase domain-containing protein, partial [Candidatus Xenobia bacterium]
TPPCSQLNPDVPAGLDAVLARMMALQPADRQATIEEARAELRQVAPADHGAPVETPSVSSQTLQPGATIADHYTVETVEEVNADSARYVGCDDLAPHRTIVIYELVSQDAEKIQQQVEALSQVHPPQLISITDVVTKGRVVYLIADQVSGVTLHELLQSLEDCPPLQLAMEILDEMVYLLTILHSCQPPVALGDFSPTRLLLREGGGVRLTGFSLGHVEDAETLKPYQASDGTEGDLRALGALMHMVLTRRPPSGAPPSTLNPEVSPGLDSLVMRLLGTGEPFENIQAVARQLEELHQEAEPLVEVQQVMSGLNVAPTQPRVSAIVWWPEEAPVLRHLLKASSGPEPQEEVVLLELTARSMTFLSRRANRTKSVVRVVLRIPRRGERSAKFDIRGASVVEGSVQQAGFWRYRIDLHDMPAALVEMVTVVRNQRRHAPRFPCRLTVTGAELPGGEATALDIGATGVGLSCAGEVALGSVFEMALHFNGEAQQIGTARVRARVVHCSPTPSGPWVVGIHFDAITPGGASRLKRFLLEHQDHPAPAREDAPSGPGKVVLEAIQGALKGRRFEFSRSDTFIFGRATDCDGRLPESDHAISRHHFQLEINPPHVRVRDLCSLNGTTVNGVKMGSRQVPRQTRPELDLKEGDIIKVGETSLRVVIDVVVACARCGSPLGPGQRTMIGPNTWVCPACVEGEGTVRCSQCQKDASREVPAGGQGDYVCLDCRQQVQTNPWQVLQGFLVERRRRQDPTPLISDQYDIERTLGKGGFGAVYLARRKRDGQQVAIKVLLGQVAVNDAARREFLREMELTASLDHPNTVKLFEAGGAGSAFYFAMEYCAGGSVVQWQLEIDRGMTVAEATPIMLGVAEGLAYCHANKLVHRDVKPSNILLSKRPDGIAKLSDFGLARNFEQAGLSGTASLIGGHVGTYPFMAREQVTGKNVRPVTDVWGLAASYYNMLTGEFARDFHPDRDPVDVIMHDAPIPIRKRAPEIPEALAEVLDRALHDDPVERYDDGAAFLKALKAVL